MTTYLVSTQSGSNTNGGTSTAVLATGADGIVSTAGGTTKITSISATWTSALVGQGIYASSGTITRKISAVQAGQTAAGTTNSTTTITSSAAFNATMLGCAISGPGIAANTYISAYGSSSSMTLSTTAGAGSGAGTFIFGPLATTTGTTAFTSATGQTWNVGGMKATITQALVTTSGLPNILAGGDLIYVGGGVYREVPTPAVSASLLATTFNGSGGSSIATIGSTLPLASVTGLVAPPAGYYSPGYVMTSTGQNVAFTYTGISGSNLTGVVWATNTTVTSAATIGTSAALTVCSPVFIIGDVDGSQTGNAGQVTMTCYTTNDKTAPSSSPNLTLGTHTGLYFALITFIRGGGALMTNSANGRFYAFIRCTFNGWTANGTGPNFTSSTTGLPLSIIFDRCKGWIMGTSSASWTITLATTTSGSADWDALLTIVNSTFFIVGVSQAIDIASSGANTFKGGGIRVYNSQLVGVALELFFTNSASLSTTVPCEVQASVLACYGNGATALDANTSGQIVENYNVFYAGTPRTNVTAGANSPTNETYAPIVELGQSLDWAGVNRQFMAPDGAGSPWLGFGAAGAGGSYPTIDLANRPRPSGGGSASFAIGPLELHDFAIQETSTVPAGQTSAGKLVGPGDQFIYVPVDATPTVITIQIEQGSGYTGTTYATATLLANGELGITAQVETCSSTLSSYQTLTFGSITASKQGWVTVRITSYDTSGTGITYFGALT